MIDSEKFSTMERVAEKLYRAGVFSAEVKSADTAFAIILAGDELGFEPMAAARNIALVKGKVSLSADAMVGIVKRSAVCAAWHVVATSATDCTITTTRTGDATPTVLTYTIAMATRAGLTGSQTWRAHPEAMLRARCGAALARAVYPDVCGGLYEPDEAEEIKRGGRHEEPRDDAPAQIAAPDALAAFCADLADATDLAGVRVVYGRHELGGTSAKPVTAAVVARVGALGYYLNGAEVTALLGGTMPDATVLAYDSLAAVDRHADDEDGDGVVADVARILRRCGGVEAPARVKTAAVSTCTALGVEGAAARIKAALPLPTPPTTPTGTDAPAASAPASASGAPVAAGSSAGPVMVLDADEVEARILRADAVGAATWAERLPLYRGTWAMCGAYWKRHDAFRAAGTDADRYAATLAAIVAHEGRGEDAARQALDGYRTRRVMPQGVGAVIRMTPRAQRAATRTGTDG
jgi:hypothetical protein